MTLGQIIDAGLNPLLTVVHCWYLRRCIKQADRSEDVERRNVETARANELYFQEKSLSLRTRLADLERNQVSLPSMISNFINTGSVNGDRTGTEG